MFLITRPLEKANQTKELFEKAGVDSFVCPAQRIIRLNPTIEKREFSYAIVTSTYAAEWLVKQELKINHIIAIGNATRIHVKRHRKYQNYDVLMPDKSNSEGVLDMPLLSNITGQSILLLKGVDGRNLLENELIQRKADLSILETYRRQSNITDLLIRQVEELPIKCIIVTSTEIASLIMNHLPDEWLANKSWIAASERIANFLSANNYSRISVSHGASDAALLEAATQLDESKREC